MASCKAKRKNGTICGQTIMKCKKCGRVGCYTGNDNCPNSIKDKNGHCKSCGSTSGVEYLR